MSFSHTLASIGTNTVVGAIAVSAVAAVLAYINAVIQANRKNRLDRLDRQLSQLYGPLFAAMRASDAAWNAFHETYWPDRDAFFDPDAQLSEEDEYVWRTWMTEVFMPLNLRMEEAIMSHADLLEGEEFPETLVALIAHIAGYKEVLKRWQEEDYSVNTSVINFPDDVNPYVYETFRQLKARQQRLL